LAPFRGLKRFRPESPHLQFGGDMIGDRHDLKYFDALRPDLDDVFVPRISDPTEQEFVGTDLLNGETVNYHLSTDLTFIAPSASR
jgi:hypothetical protein